MTKGKKCGPLLGTIITGVTSVTPGFCIDCGRVTYAALCRSFFTVSIRETATSDQKHDSKLNRGFDCHPYQRFQRHSLL